MIAELIGPAFFEHLGSQSEVLLWVLSAGAIALLVYGADRAVGAAASLAAAAGLSKVVIGATVVSLGTTSPEAAVSVAAAIHGNPGLALGNGVGSIICDTALIFGLCCCLRRLPKDRFILNRHGWVQFGSGALLTATALALWAFSGDINAVEIPRAVGFGFLGLLVWYMVMCVRWSRARRGVVAHGGSRTHEADGDVAPTKHKVVCLLSLVFGLALVVCGSELLVGSMKDICRRHEVPPAVIAVTFVALGTSLPELVTAITAIRKGHPDLLVGNIIGADILNVLFVIGASAAATPLKIEPVFFTFLLPSMMAVLLLLRVYGLGRSGSFRRWQGIPLLAAYVVFVSLAVWLGTAGAH